MTKGIIIIGAAGSGKTMKAKYIAKMHHDNEVVWIDTGYNPENHFAFWRCTKNTKLIIFDEIKSDTKIEDFEPLIEAVRVNKRGFEPFIIHPRIIIVYAEGISKEDFRLGSSFYNRFDIIECIKKEDDGTVQRLPKRYYKARSQHT